MEQRNESLRFLDSRRPRTLVQAMTDTRQRLPERRPNETFRLRHVWGRGTPSEQAETMQVSVGWYPDGRIGEVFINCDNHLNERAIATWHDIGVLVSIALQHGATIEELSSAMTRGEAPVLGSNRTELVAGSPAGTVLEALARTASR